MTEIHQLTDAYSDDESRGSGRRNPSRRVRCPRGQRLRKSRKCYDARRTLGCFQSPENLCVLSRQSLGREAIVGVGSGVEPKRFEPR